MSKSLKKVKIVFIASFILSLALALISSHLFESKINKFVNAYFLFKQKIFREIVTPIPKSGKLSTLIFPRVRIARIEHGQAKRLNKCALCH